MSTIHIHPIRRRVYTSGEHIYYLTSTGEWLRFEFDGDIPAGAMVCAAPASPTLHKPEAPAVEAGSPVEVYFEAWSEAREAEAIEGLVDLIESSVVAGGGSWACFLGTGDPEDGERAVVCVLAVGDSPSQARTRGWASDFHPASESLDESATRLDALATSGHLHVRQCSRRFFAVFDADEETAAVLTDSGRVDLSPEALDGWDDERPAERPAPSLRMVN